MSRIEPGSQRLGVEAEHPEGARVDLAAIRQPDPLRRPGIPLPVERFEETENQVLAVVNR
jgi:hypothetical protein